MQVERPLHCVCTTPFGSFLFDRPRAPAPSRSRSVRSAASAHMCSDNPNLPKEANKAKCMAVACFVLCADPHRARGSSTAA